MPSAPADCTLKFPSLSAQERAAVGTSAARKGLTIDEYARTCMGYGYPAKSIAATSPSM